MDINGLVWSPDSKWLLSAGDGLLGVRIWDAELLLRRPASDLLDLFWRRTGRRVQGLETAFVSNRLRRVASKAKKEGR